MAKKKKQKRKKNNIKKIKKWLKTNKTLVIIIAIIAGLLTTFFWTKIVLYANFLLGNDIIVKLDVDKRYVYLEHGQENNITFEAKATTNPFCNALCKSTFMDVSNNNLIDDAEFTLKPGSPLRKSYTLKPKETGFGLKLYRFDMECKSSSSLLCHTKEEPSTRSILVALEYNLTKEEEELKINLKENLENLKNQLGIIEGEQIFFDDLSKRLSNKLIFDDKTDVVREELVLLNDDLQGLKEVWEKQDYNLLSKNIEIVKSDFEETEQNFEEFNILLYDLVYRYNLILDNLKVKKENLNEFRQKELTNNKTILEINKTINDFNYAVKVFNERSSISEKEKIENDISEEINLLRVSVDEELRKEAMHKELEVDINYDVLCEINNTCTEHPSIEERSNQSEFDLKLTCNRINSMQNLFSEVNHSVKEQFINQSYPDTNEFWNNISIKIKNMKNKVIKDYLEMLPEEQINTELIMELLKEQPYVESEDYPGYNLSYALIAELVNQQPDICLFPNITIDAVKEIKAEKIELNESAPVKIYLEFEEQKPECCVFGECKECCIEDSCKYDPLNYPVVFLHGHAVNKDVSAEYSLEGFNKIQKKLEEDGYLNAGTVTLFSATDFPEGLWGLIPMPLTIRTSYYFDIFKQPDNYVVVQAKSENIDTYAVRLKDLVDAIKYKTGKSKINIIAFSMGGLVARRYVQIFGTERVNKLILIGTPNKGIVGNILDYCPITGERLECRDMNSDSLFINKLNSGKLPNIPIYNIIGTGCKMDHGIGDGAVLEEKAFLEGANNFIINGTCSSKVEPLHLKLREIDIYPQVYDILLGALKD